MQKDGSVTQTILYQTPNLIRFLCSFLLVYMVWPAVMFRGKVDNFVDRLVSGYIKMVGLSIGLVYLLVVIKLYELLTLFLVLSVITLYKRLPPGNRWKFMQQSKTTLLLRLFDLIDGKVSLLNLLQAIFAKIRIKISWPKGQFSKSNITFALVFTGLLFYALYLRYYDAFTHAAPAMSDSYVTLAWMKYIEEKILFHDGIYPQGFHIYLSVLRKFAATDALYILKYCGPLNGVLCALGLGLMVLHITKQKWSALITFCVFGVAGQILPMEWVRQAATNSQEFALVFLAPAWYYGARFLQTGDKADLVTAAVAFTVIGLVHSLVWAFLWPGIICLIIAYLMVYRKAKLKVSGQLILAVGISGVISLIPLGVGLIMSKPFNSSSEQFLLSSLNGGIPPINYLDIVALSGFGLFFLVSMVRRNQKEKLALALFALLLGVSAFGAYELLGYLTKSAVLVARIGILWALVASFGVGLLWESCLQIFLSFLRWRKFVEPFLFVIVVLGSLFYLGPSPAAPYKMQYDSSVNQYIRISQEFTPTDWLMVSNKEGYDLALGRGWSLPLVDFLNDFVPTSKELIGKINGKTEKIEDQDIFIFLEKKEFQVPLNSMEPTLKQRQINYTRLQQWLKSYQKTHNNLSVFYEDQDIEVYQIHQPRPNEQSFQDIWNPKK